MTTITITEVREKFPQYNDLSDQQLADALHKKFYSDMPPGEFYTKIGLGQTGAVPEPAAVPAAAVAATFPAMRDQAMDDFARRVEGARYRLSGVTDVGDRPPSGFARGVVDVSSGIGQLATKAVGAVTPQSSGIGQWAEDAAAKEEKRYRTEEDIYRRQHGGQLPGIDWPRIAGNVAATAPLAYAMPGAAAATLPVRLAAGAGQGALGGVVQPVDTSQGGYWGQKGVQTGVGALGGAGTTGLLSGVGRVISPKSSPQVAMLRAEGVAPTPGQMMAGGKGWVGSAVKRLEEGAATIPFIGDIVRSGQRRAVMQFNRAAVNRILKPLGKVLPKTVAAGRDAIDYAAKIVDDAYEAVVPRLTAKVDAQFSQDLNHLVSNAGFMVKQRVDQFSKVLDEQVLRKISPNGTVTGESLKEIESTLGHWIRTYSKSIDADQRLLGDAYTELQAMVRSLIRRSNPGKAADLRNANRAYATLLRVENAAGRPGSKGGIFSPAGLRGASRAMDSSLRKRQFTRGRAMMQDLGEAGEDVLGRTVPDSGTPYRIMAGAGLLGAPALLDPWTATALLGAGGMYAPGVQRMIAGLMASRPPGAAHLARGVRAASPAAATASGQLGHGLLQGYLGGPQND